MYRGYRALFGGKKFTSFSDHPNKTISLSGYTSSAAGAYQILSRTWNSPKAIKMKSELGIGDFSPASQDKFVIWLIDNRGALIQVANGLIRNAVLKTNGEWASLPESPYGQPAQTMQGALDVFKKAISNEIKGESEIATPKGQLDETIKKLK